MKDRKKEVNYKMVEHPLKQDRLTCQDVVEKVKTQVTEIFQQYEYFKIKINEYIKSS